MKKSYYIKQKLIYVIGLFIVLCSCEGDYHIRYEWKGIKAYSADNSQMTPIVSSADSISKNNYSIKLIMDMVELSRTGKYADSETPPVNINELDSLIITSNFDFSTSHKAGDNLVDFFTILNDSYFHTIPANGSEDYNITKIYSPDFDDNPSVEYIDLLLMTPPTVSLNHKFKIQFILKDETTFIDSTELIKLY